MLPLIFPKFINSKSIVFARTAIKSNNLALLAMKRRFYLLYQKKHVYKVLVLLVTNLKSDSQVQKEKKLFASMESAKSCLHAHVLGVLACLAFLSSYLFCLHKSMLCN